MTPARNRDRNLKYSEAIAEAIDLCMASDPSVYLIGLGVPDPKGIFGTTRGLQEKYGPLRVMDMPASENGVTGIITGSALVGMRPIMTHQRIDFSLLALEQIINQAAKWHYMFLGQARVPIVIRMVVGRGWGQGPQHSQSLQALYAHIPGLKVVMPATPFDAKGLLISSVEDNNPVVFIEQRWLYDVEDAVPEGVYRVPLGEARLVREGSDVSIIATSYMVLEAVRAADILAQIGVSVEVVDVRTLRPFDRETIVNSVRRTRRVMVADTGWKTGGFGAEILATIAEEASDVLRARPRRLGMLDCPVPTTPALSKLCYPGAADLVTGISEMLGVDPAKLSVPEEVLNPPDVPHVNFVGPF
jgi:pyruvate dehydrogenase E1 component beta subunit